ncbi:striated muscle preferentially expressed protein kinase-like [Oncorhynchus nerka]|uniref:striated muscle preferentially expressed protein kinase-like n=1 Tax=Oncorhynchus nerka TaxID=8023 RepID=UPI0031B84A50
MHLTQGRSLGFPSAVRKPSHSRRSFFHLCLQHPKGPLADKELEQPPPGWTCPRVSAPTTQRTPPTYPKGPSSPKELEKPLHHRRSPSPRSPSPTMQRGPSPTNAKEPASAYPPKPPRLSPTPISTTSISPLTKRRKGEPGRTSPALKMTIPTILVEDELMEMEEEEAGEKREREKMRRAGKKEGRASKTQKKGKVSGKSWESQPMSPETGDDSDDSYMSADEGPAEKPAFERPLGDTIATAGSEVLLKCVITGSPLPIGRSSPCRG